MPCRPIEFETDLFKGKACIWIQGLPSTPPSLFKGKQRKSMITVQGRFKQRVAFEDCLSGQEFARPARELPPRWLVESVLIKVRLGCPARIHSNLAGVPIKVEAWFLGSVNGVIPAGRPALLLAGGVCAYQHVLSPVLFTSTSNGPLECLILCWLVASVLIEGSFGAVR